ncbi:MAG: sensor histidine kinase [Ekhidna sp.]
MKSKITILIIASLLGFFALSAIQAYLINNTYELKKDAFMEVTTEAVTVIDDHLTKIDSLRSEWRDTMLEIVAGHKQGYVTKDSILYYFQLKTDSLNDVFADILSQELERLDIDRSLKFQKKVLSIVVIEPHLNDTIYNSENNPTSYILGVSFEEEGRKISGSTSYSEYSFDNEIEGQSMLDMVKVNFETETLINIEGWERQVLGEMKGLLFISLAIFLFVFGILFYSIKNLITQKKIAELKTDFINNISHEFKTPLATLTLATGMLRETSMKNDSILPETVEIIDRQGRRLQKLLDQVLDNTMSHTQIKLSKTEVNIENFINSLLDDFELSVSGSQPRLSRELKLDKSTIVIDPFYVTTALLNILDNGVKYNNENVELHVSAQVTNQFRISIKDNGIGISRKNQAHLFDKFYRVGNKEIHEIKGLGLGLFYAGQIVKAHNGNISVESSEGRGSTITIELPLN